MISGPCEQQYITLTPGYCFFRGTLPNSLLLQGYYILSLRIDKHYPAKILIYSLSKYDKMNYSIF